MVRCRVCVAHGHRQRLVAQEALQGQDLAAVHDEAAGEGVPKYVRGLSRRQQDFRGGQRLVEARSSRSKKPEYG